MFVIDFEDREICGNTWLRSEYLDKNVGGIWYFLSSGTFTDFFLLKKIHINNKIVFDSKGVTIISLSNANGRSLRNDFGIAVVGSRIEILVSPFDPGSYPNDRITLITDEIKNVI